MEEWHYDPEADLDPAFIEPLQRGLHGGGLFVRGLRRLIALAERVWLHGYHRLTIVGRHQLPLNQSFILVANHASHLDAPCLLAALPLHRVPRAFPAAASDYFGGSTLRARLARLLVNYLPFDRWLTPWASLSVCARLLAEPGTVLVLFPEGTRSAGPEPGDFKPGVGLLVAGREIPVVPCYLAGTNAALPKGAWIPRPRSVRLTLGVPRRYTHLPSTRESAKFICEDLRQAVLALGGIEPRTKRDVKVIEAEAMDSPILKP